MIEKKLFVRGQHINVLLAGSSHLPVIVCLHGFTGSVETWREVIGQLKDTFHIIAIDLTGHGKTSTPSNPSRYSMAEQIEDLQEVFQMLKITSFSLVGYSMGGRIALAYTLTYPHYVKHLILESTSPGLKTEKERQQRRAHDAELAKRIQSEGIHSFVQFWESIPLFQSQKQLSVEKRERIRKERLLRSEKGLANSLLGIGTGSQPSYWSNLQNLPVPTTVLSGLLDQKFVDISREMTKAIPNCRRIEVENVGHAIHVENPSLFATIIKEQLLSETF